MTSVIMTIAAIVMLGLILASWYAIKAILTIKGDAAVVIRELESIHSAIANNDAKISRHQQYIDFARKDSTVLEDGLSKTQRDVDKLCIDVTNLINQVNVQAQTITTNSQGIQQLNSGIIAQSDRLERNAEERERCINNELATLRSYIDKRIDKSSNKILHIDESELVNSVKELVMSLGKIK